jgi:hypothetical protein
MLTPGDDVRTRYPTKLHRTLQARKDGKLADSNFSSEAGFGIGGVSEPFQLGRHFGEMTELDRGQCALIIPPRRCRDVSRHRLLDVLKERMGPRQMTWRHSMSRSLIRQWI